MPRRRKIEIKIGSPSSLQDLYEDIYHDLYTLRNQLINDLARMNNQSLLEDDHSVFQIYKTRANLHGVLNSNAMNKIQLAKLISSNLDLILNDNATEDDVISEELLSMVHKIIKGEEDSKTGSPNSSS